MKMIKGDKTTAVGIGPDDSFYAMEIHCFLNVLQEEKENKISSAAKKKQGISSFFDTIILLEEIKEANV